MSTQGNNFTEEVKLRRSPRLAAARAMNEQSQLMLDRQHRFEQASEEQLRTPPGDGPRTRREIHFEEEIKSVSSPDRVQMEIWGTAINNLQSENDCFRSKVNEMQSEIDCLRSEQQVARSETECYKRKIQQKDEEVQRIQEYSKTQEESLKYYRTELVNVRAQMDKVSTQYAYSEALRQQESKERKEVRKSMAEFQVKLTQEREKDLILQRSQEKKENYPIGTNAEKTEGYSAQKALNDLAEAAIKGEDSEDESPKYK